jgi:hypothetical protein
MQDECNEQEVRASETPSLQEFHDGDIVRCPDFPRTRFRIKHVATNGKDSCASFEPVKKDGSRDRRWDVGFTGNLVGCTLIERCERESKL